MNKLGTLAIVGSLSPCNKSVYAVVQAGSTCNVEPWEVPCDSKAPPCG
jgi:hypothetical protein